MENNCQANQSIACTVQQCRYHCENPTVVECTDCQSFKVKESCC